MQLARPVHKVELRVQLVRREPPGLPGVKGHPVPAEAREQPEQMVLREVPELQEHRVQLVRRVLLEVQERSGLPDQRVQREPPEDKEV